MVGCRVYLALHGPSLVLRGHQQAGKVFPTAPVLPVVALFAYLLERPVSIAFVAPSFFFFFFSRASLQRSRTDCRLLYRTTTGGSFLSKTG